ncbi:MAG: protein kinase [Anaerolineaceae bacterium]|nr:protein kinase [Anaerolineaceae bacterium]
MVDNLQGTLLKSYKLEERIGNGGFGAVYRAKQPTIGREVAVKIILPGYANNADFIRRFESEAHLIARLEHPHITPLHDFWRDPDGAYLVMRYLKGGSVRDALQDGSFELSAVSQLLDQIASALDFAHRNNVIHRDIKPGNILLDEDGNAYLADFGIAKDLAGLTDNKTAADAVVGSLDYISPEQARSEPVTSRTDIYSLGVTLYEMITGIHPFQNTSSIERLYKHINDPLPEIISLPTNICEAVNDCISKATAKNPQDRYPDVLAFAVAFREAIGRGVTRQDGDIVEQLTMREQEVLAMIAKNMSNREISEELVVTMATVKWHVTQLYKKLGVRSRVQAIVRARELNLIVTGDTMDDLPFISGHAVSVSLPEPENPYKGLHAFQMTDARDFFGRDELTNKLVDRLCDDDPYHRFLAVVGPSGSGKSSLVKAGLIPALWKGAITGSERWFVVDMIPGTHPLDKLETALIRVAANQTSQLREQIQRDERGLLRVADIILPEDDTELVIVVDQFEEVFTLVEDENARQHFLDLLRVAVSDVRSRVRVVVTLRADYYDRPLHYPDFGELIRNRMETVLPLTAKGLERAVRGPAERVGVTFEQGLVEQIVSQMNYQAGALPLLQYALTELFDRRQGRLLTNEAYQQIGGAIGALANRADEIYRGLTQEAQELTQQMFMRLVTLGEGSEDTRRRATHAELLSITETTDLMEEIIDQFAAYRLLSLDHDPQTRQPIVEVAHEAILREWDRLRKWLNESREDIRQERVVSRAAQDWHQQQRDVSYLLHGARLDQVEKWCETTTLVQTPLEQAFIAESLKQRERVHQLDIERKTREARLERRSRNFLRGLVAVFAVAAVIAGGLSVLAFSLNAQSQRSAAEFRSIALTFGAQDTTENNSRPDLALALAHEAVNMDDPPVLAQQIFFKVATSTPIRWRITEHHASVFNVDFSPDGRKAVTIGWDGRAILWDVATHETLQSLQYEGGRLVGVEFHPSGDIVAVSSWDDSMLILWHLDTDETDKYPLDRGWLPIIDFTSDGSRLIVATQSGGVVMLEVATGEILKTFQEGTAALLSAAFSPDDRYIVSVGQENAIRIWDAETGEIVQTLKHPGDDDIWLFRAVFLADSERILSGGTDGIMYLWDWRTGDILQTYPQGEDEPRHVQDITLNAEETLVATGDDRGRLYIWDVATGRLEYTYLGHKQRIRNLEFSPDGKTILTGSNDGTAVLLDVYGAGVADIIALDIPSDPSVALSPKGNTIAIGTTEAGNGAIQIRDSLTGVLSYTFGQQPSFVNVLAYSPDGKIIVSGDSTEAVDAGYAYVWNSTTGELIAVLDEHSLGIGDIAFSPDGKRAAISETQGARILIWDTQTWEVVLHIDEPNDWVGAVAFSPDGSKLYAGSRDGTISVWDSETGDSRGNLAESLGYISSLTLNRDGSRLIAAASTDAIVFDTNTGELVHTLTYHAPFLVVDATYSPDERYILTSSTDHTLILWDAQTGEPIHRLVGHTDQVWAGYFSEDGQTITSISTYEIIHWDLKSLLQGYASWVVENRYMPAFTCEQRELYQIEPLCKPEL